MNAKRRSTFPDGLTKGQLLNQFYLHQKTLDYISRLVHRGKRTDVVTTEIQLWSLDKLFSIMTNSVPGLHDRTHRGIRGSETRVSATAWLETLATLHETGINRKLRQNCAHNSREGQYI